MSPVARGFSGAVFIAMGIAYWVGGVLGVGSAGESSAVATVLGAAGLIAVVSGVSLIVSGEGS